MKISIRRGFGFGLTSGIITTLGLIVGLNSGTESRAVVLGGIFVIAFADAMSDSLGIHISEEFSEKHSGSEIWESTISTFLTKFIVALTFIFPVLFLPLDLAVKTCIFWGLGLIAIFSYVIAKQQKVKPYKIIAEHLVIAVMVIIITFFVGQWAGKIK